MAMLQAIKSKASPSANLTRRFGGLARRIKMARFHVVAIAVGLMLAVSGPSFAAKRTLQKSHAKSAVNSQSYAAEPGGLATRTYDRDDPYAPGVNWPGHW